MTKSWLYLYPPPISVNSTLIEVTECLESTTADVNIKLPTSLTTIYQSDIYSSTTPLDVDQASTEWIVVRVAVYIRPVKDNMRYGAYVVPIVV